MKLNSGTQSICINLFDIILLMEQNVLSIPKQLEYFMHYKMKLQKLVGEKRAKYIINNAVIVMSMGTNDFLQNYYLEPIRSKQYTVEEYQNFLVSRVDNHIKVVYSSISFWLIFYYISCFTHTLALIIGLISIKY